MSSTIQLKRRQNDALSLIGPVHSNKSRISYLDLHHQHYFSAEPHKRGLPGSLPHKQNVEPGFKYTVKRLIVTLKNFMFHIFTIYSTAEFNKYEELLCSHSAQTRRETLLLWRCFHAQHDYS